QLQQANLFTSDVALALPAWSGPGRNERGDGRRDNRPPSLDRVPAADTGATDRQIVRVPTTIEERRAWVEARSAEDKLALKRKFDRFTALSPAEQSALRELDAALAEGDYSGPLALVMLRYSDWLESFLSLADRGALEDMPV